MMRHWMRQQRLFISDKVKKSKLEEGGMSDKIRSNEVRGSEAKKR